MQNSLRNFDFATFFLNWSERTKNSNKSLKIEQHFYNQLFDTIDANYLLLLLSNDFCFIYLFFDSFMSHDVLVYKLTTHLKCQKKRKENTKKT